jgi:hypothetical protein
MNNNKLAQPPYIAQKIISLCLANAIKDEILGDLEEEFHAHLAHSADSRQAKYKYWKQAIITIFQFIAIRGKNSLLSSNIKQRISITVGVIIFFISLLLISWLSHLVGFEGFSQGMELELSQGSPHKALVQAQFWQISFLNLKYANTLDYFFQFESFMWAIFTITVINLIDKKHFIKNKLMIFSSNVMVFLPYITGSIFLEFTHYPIQQVGVMLAKMIFSIFYLIIPITYLTYRNLSTRNEHE